MIRMVRHGEARCATAGPDDGITLVELLVTMGLLTVIGAMISTLSILGTQKAAESQVQSATATSAEAGVEVLSRTLRAAVNLYPDAYSAIPSAPGFADASPNRAVFYSYAKTAPGAGPSRLEDAVVANTSVPGDWQLVESTYPASGPSPYSWPVAPATVRVLAHGLADPSRAPPVFTYFPIPGDTFCRATPGPTPPSIPPLSPPPGTAGAYIGLPPTSGLQATVNSVSVTLTLTGSSTGSAAASHLARPVVVTAQVTANNSNTADTRKGTCL